MLSRITNKPRLLITLLLLCLLHGVAARADYPTTNFWLVECTNGIFASASYRDYRPNDIIISLKCYFTPPSTNVPYIPIWGGPKRTLDNGSFVRDFPGDCAIYFGPSNLFCGPVRLVDANGHEIPCLRSNEMRFSDYPMQYSLQKAREELKKGYFFLKTGEREPHPITGSVGEFALFELRKTFQVEKPGDYQLTIWPIIYKRVKAGWDYTNPDIDICHRIDLAPITLPIHWSGVKTN